MALRAILSRYDFTSEEIGRAVTYKVYDESHAAFNLTGYTVTAEILTFNKSVSLAVTTTPDVGSGGTGSFTFTATGTITAKGLRYIRFKLEQSNIRIYTAAKRILVTP